MLSVIINDPETLLTKSQKMKLKEKFKTWILNNETEELTQKVLNSITYQSDKQYDQVSISIKDEEYTLTFSKIDRDNLREKLKFKLKSKTRNDPKWIAYQNLKNKGAKLGNGEDIPDPDFISKNREMFTTQMSIIEKIKNPFVEYLKLCLAMN